MSPWLPKATVAIEDSRFWQHGALDYQGIARALYEDVTRGADRRRAARRSRSSSSATSTSATPQRTLSRKVKEACLAEKLAQTLDEEADPRRVPERGLLRPARVRRAGRRADVLLDERGAADARRRPRCSPGCRRRRRSTTRVRHPDARAARRNEVLRAMLAERRHHAAQYASAVGDAARPEAGHALQRAAPPELLRLGGGSSSSSASAQRQVEAGGLQVRTTLDPRMQYARARTPSASVLRDEDRSRGGARRDRPAHRRGEGDGRLPARRAAR